MLEALKPGIGKEVFFLHESNRLNWIVRASWSQIYHTSKRHVFVVALRLGTTAAHRH